MLRSSRDPPASILRASGPHTDRSNFPVPVLTMKGFAMSLDRLSYDTDTSSAVQGEIQSLADRLESLIGEREKAVNSAMSDFSADGVSADYQSVEDRFRHAASETRNIIGLVKQTLNLNDQTASGARTRARNAVQNIG